MSGGPAWRDRVGDPRQFASARLLEWADGPERGGRVVVLSSGAGLDAWVMVDRSFDIGPLSFRGRPVAWQGAAGYPDSRVLDRWADGAQGFNRGLGGFLVTCGLEHVRAAAPGFPQHGRLPFTPGRLRGYGEDWDTSEPVLFCEGEVIQARYGGEALRLLRRVEVPVGGATLRIRDTVENRAGEAQPHAVLYHFNLGWPTLEDGARVMLDGTDLLPPVRLADPAARSEARSHPGGAGHAVLLAPGGAAMVSLRFDTATLPVFQTWTDLRPRAGVLAMEPCTSARAQGGGSEGTVVLAPGECRRYAIDAAFGDATCGAWA